jgi:hypothetical protein
MKRPSFFNLSPYTIAKYCSDLRDIETGMNELRTYIGQFERAKDVPQSALIRLYKLKQKQDAMMKKMKNQPHMDGLFGPYRPMSSNCKLLDVNVPDGMDWESMTALANLQKEIGENVTGWVAKKLKYTDAEVCSSLAAEQIDAVAAAIWNIENKGQGIIIGDQTGIGKGRQAAAIIRYGIVTGRKPVFITEGANLFSDFYRDMAAIGSEKYVPFIVNAREDKSNVKDENGTIVFAAPEKEVQEVVFAGSTKALGKYDYVMATYSQFSKNKSDEKTGMLELDKKGRFLMDLATDNIFILDESHNAAGASNTGAFFSACVGRTKGTIFLSATFAKKPDNMAIYALKTCLSDANLNPEQFKTAFDRGGVALQEVVAAQLAQEGQMFRRERAYDGVEVNYITLTDKGPQHRAQADVVTDIIRDIIKFQEIHIDGVINRMDDLAAGQQGRVEKTKGTKNGGVDNTPYFSKVFNVINQMLFTLKAEDVANHAIQLLKQDKKVVIAFSSTMGTFLDEFESGEVVKADFSEVLKRGLRSTLSYSVKDSRGKSTKHYLKLSELNPEAYQAYMDLSTKIDKSSTGLNISPIDLVVEIITRAGYRVAEITGRNTMIQFRYTDEQAKAAKENAEAKRASKEKLKNYPTEGPLNKADQIKPLARKLMHPHQVLALTAEQTEEHWGIFDELQAAGEILLKRNLDREAKEYKKNHPATYRSYSEEIALPTVHFFNSSSDWYIFEWDGDDRLFGYAILNGDLQNAEWGYVSLSELHGNYGFGRNVELDFFYSPSPIATILKAADVWADGIGDAGGEVNTKVGMVAPRKKENKADAFRKFQNNEIDVLLINQSGATGASAHAIPTAKVPRDQVKQRVMIVLQPELDINREVQKRGRINRTGQIIKPRYDYFSTTIPAEQRLMMMLQKKLKSLDANTSAKADQSKAILDVPDFLNKYGDKVVYQWLTENPETNAMIDNPLSIKDGEEDAGGRPKSDQTTDASRRVTGRIAVLPTKDQERFYSEVVETYDRMIHTLKQSGTYDLEIETMPLDAVSLERKMIIINANPTRSVFSNHTFLETFDCINLRKPYTKEEIEAMINAELKDANGDTAAYQRALVADLDAFVEKRTAYLEAYVEKLRDEMLAKIKTEKKYLKLDSQDDKDLYIVERTQAIHEWAEMKLEAEMNRLNNQTGMIRQNMNFFYPGRSIYFPQITADDATSLVPGIFLGWNINQKRDNPYAPSAITLAFALASSIRRLDVPLSGDFGLKVNLSRAESYVITAGKHLEEWDVIARKGMAGRKNRFIVTGNVLQALAADAYKNGQFISFTLQDGGVRKGYLLPESFSTIGSGSDRNKEMLIPVPCYLAKDYIFERCSRRYSVQTNQGLVFEQYHGAFAMVAQMSKAIGGKFYQDPVLIKLTDAKNWDKRGSFMVGLIYEKENVWKALEYLQNEMKVNIMVTESEMSKLTDIIPEGFDDAVIEEVKHEPLPIIEPEEVENAFVDDEMELMEMEALALALELELLSFVSGLFGADGVTIRRNFVHNGIEVKFRSQPSYDTTSKLKRLGFKFSSRQGLWYAKYSSSLLTRVEELFDVEETASSMPSDLMVNVVQPAPKIDNAARLEEWKRLNQDAIKIASMPLGKFFFVSITDLFPKATITFDNGKFEMDWNPKKGVFEHLPPKRKRPDTYTRLHVHKLAIRGCLKAGLLVPIEIIQSNPELLNLSTPYSWVYAKNDFNRLENEYPIIATDPDYQRIKEFLSEKAHEEEQNGILWDMYRAKALTSWKENKTPVYVHHNGAWQRGKIDFFERELGGQRKDVVQVLYGSGYIIMNLTTLLERVYVENPNENPSAKTLLDLFPFEDVMGIQNPYKPSAPKAEADDFALVEMEAEALALELELLTI